MNSVVDALVSLAARLADDRDPLGIRAREDMVADGGLSPAMADRVLTTTVRRYTPDALAALCNDSLANRTVHVVLSNSVPTAPLRALALPLLRGASILHVKPSRHQPRFVATLCEHFPFDSVHRDRALHALAGDHVIAYGADFTIQDLRAELPDEATFEGHRHGYGIALVGPNVDPHALARDIADYDQRGCLSPQAVYLVGTPAQAVDLARSLHRALAQQPPRGSLEAGEAADWMQWQGIMAEYAAVFYRGPQHGVAALAKPDKLMMLTARHIVILPVASVAEAMDCVGDESPWLTCIGVADLPRPLTLPSDVLARVVPVGTMQDPPLDGPEDPRPPVRELATPR